ncbi:12557_t:CDS:2, partial [Gigaspora rosea]
ALVHSSEKTINPSSIPLLLDKYPISTLVEQYVKLIDLSSNKSAYIVIGYEGPKKKKLGYKPLYLAE